MGLINFTAVQDNTTADAGDVNPALNTIYDEFNGNIEAANLAAGTITAAKIADDTITADKFSSTNVEVFANSPSSNTDVTSSSYVDVFTIGTLSIPTWATKAIVTLMGTADTLTSAVDGDVRIEIGGTDTSAGHRIPYSSHPNNQIFQVSFLEEVSLSVTGSQALKLQAKRAAGAGDFRFYSQSKFFVKVEYYP